MRHATRPGIEPLEPRELLTLASGSTRASMQLRIVQHSYHDYVGFLQFLELHSNATPAESVALRDDALAISQAASTTPLPRVAAEAKAADASTILDRAFLDGFLDPKGWSDIRSRLASTLDGLNVPADVIDQTIADMQAAADSAGVSAGAYLSLATKAERLRVAEVNLPAGYGHYDDPQLYYTQHLRGFIRGGTAEKNRARADLNAQIATITSDSSARRLLNRDASALISVANAVPSDRFADVQTAVRNFVTGPASPDATNQLRQDLLAAVGPGASRASVAAIDRIVSDGPSLRSALGESAGDADLWTGAIHAFVAAGGGQGINAYLIRIGRPPSR